MKPVSRTIYVSNCGIYQNSIRTDLEQIETSSIANNRALGVGGALILSGGNFVGILEGKPAAVEHITALIIRDPRHSALKMIHHALHGERIFEDWSLAYAGKSLFVAAIVDRAARGGESDLAQLTQMILEFARFPNP